MELGFEMELKQTQKIAIVPELQQSLKILQYPAQELHQYIQKEIELNPLLELSEEYKEDINISFDDRFPVDWKEFFRHIEYRGEDRDNMAYQGEEYDYSYENVLCKDLSLQEHLMQQLKVMDLSLTDKKIAAFIIESLDENGYLPITKHEIANLLNVGKKQVSQMLHLVQTFDPTGVGARSLRECLIIQLHQTGKLTANVRTIIFEHLKDIAYNRLTTISRALGITIEEVQGLCDLIRSLEPKPGRKFTSVRDVRYILPDVIVKKIGEEYHVLVQENSAPRLRINKMYQKILKDCQLDANVSKYIANKLHSALWIIKAIEQRRMTLNKVITSIVRRQEEFLNHGIKYLRPLTMQMVAEDCHIHVSTVSRAIDGKYVQTPRGIFEIKYFFATGLEGAEGCTVSTESVKERIRELIAKEDNTRPLSDGNIAEILKKEGIDISRRTVAKYRGELGIFNSSQRRRYY